MAEIPELWQAVMPVVELFEAWGAPFHLGGSVASSFLGIARSTLDADLVADLRPAHGPMLIRALSESYYVPEGRVQRAIQHRGSFNLIHLSTMFKVDIFVQPDRAFDKQAMARRVSLQVHEIQRELDFSSPEDIVLHKLAWYRDSNRVSNRQWKDVQGVLRLQKDQLDLKYLRGWAEDLGLIELLEEALGDAGISDAT